MAYAGTNDQAVTGYRNHVWSCDFVLCRTDEGKAFRTLDILDEHCQECLAIGVKRCLARMFWAILD